MFKNEFKVGVDVEGATKVSLFSTCADVAAASGRAWEMASAPVVGPL